MNVDAIKMVDVRLLKKKRTVYTMRNVWMVINHLKLVIDGDEEYITDVI